MIDIRASLRFLLPISLVILLTGCFAPEGKTREAPASQPIASPEGRNPAFITRENAIAAANKFLPPRMEETVTAELNPSWVYEGKAGRQTLAVWLVTYQSPGGARTTVVIDAVTGASRGVMQVEAGE